MGNKKVVARSFADESGKCVKVGGGVADSLLNVAESGSAARSIDDGELGIRAEAIESGLGTAGNKVENTRRQASVLQKNEKVIRRKDGIGRRRLPNHGHTHQKRRHDEIERGSH